MTEAHPPLTILGAGYVGQALWRRFPDAEATRRKATPGSRLHAFDLGDEATWDPLPLARRVVVWTFPAQPLEAVRRFHERCLEEVAGLVVLGSTSAYRVPDEPGHVPVVDEDAPLDLDNPRVAGEEWLRAQGATVLRLAGIFGPGREPEGWLRRGRIRDGAKIVNLIHVDDIVETIARLLVDPRPGERFNVANGDALPWSEVAARLRRAGRLPPEWRFDEVGPAPVGKRVDATRLRALMPGHAFRRA